MDREYEKAYYKQMQEYLKKNETLNESLNDTLECKPINDNKCFNNTSLNESLNEHYLPRKQYFEMLFKLEAWHVMKPKSLFFRYGLEHCYRIFKYIENAPDIRNRGAYYRVLLERNA